MKTVSLHHKHIVGHLWLAIMGIVWSIAWFMLNSIDTFASGPVTNYGAVFVWSFAGLQNQQTDLHRQYGGNDFEWLLFLRNHKTLNTPEIVSINANTKSCVKQVRWLYYNSARGQLLWPLDADSLADLQAINSSYNDLQLQWGLYIGCDGNTTNIFGQVTHTFNTLERKLVAGVNINTTTNSYTHAFANTFNINNTTVWWYLVDSVGGIASANGVGPLYGQSNGWWTGATQSGAVFNSTGTTITGTGNSWDIVTILVGGQTYTGVVWSGWTFQIPVVLDVGSNEIVIILTDPETQEQTQTTIIVSVIIPPVIDFCPNGDYTASLYDGQCGQAPTPKPINDKKSNPVVLVTDEELGICEEGEDNSDSYYDRKCTDDKHNSADEKPSNPTVDNTFDFIKEVGNVMKSMTCNISQELVEAYVFGRSMNMTTVNNICNANLLWPLRRKEMAKFSSMFALKALGKEPDKTRECSWNDGKDETDEMKAFMELSCQLGNMGLKRSGAIDEKFRPNDKVTIGEFATLVSRMLFGTVHNTPENDPRPWYQEHTKALKKAWIMTQIDKPSNEQLRWYALIVFKRVYEMINK